MQRLRVRDRLEILSAARAGPQADRESIIDALLGIRDLDLGIGIPIHYTEDSYQGSQTVWPTIIRDGRFEAFDFAPATM